MVVFVDLHFRGQIYSYPADPGPPLWEVRRGLWGLGCGAILLKGVMEKKLNGRLAEEATAAFQFVAALVNFGVSQWIHDREFNEDFSGKDTTMTGLSVAFTVFEVRPP